MGEVASRKTAEDVANGLYFFLMESTKQTRRWPTFAAVAEYYEHLVSADVMIHRETLEQDVARFVKNCLRDESLQVKAFRESRGLGLSKENVQHGRVICANEPGCE